MLTREIEFLTGVCFAAQSQSNDQPDWPPQPDRVFSALVAAWGTRGERPEERAALEWLEQQPPPVIEASEAEARRVGISFVPPNDPSGKPEVMPERRRRQPRMFPAAIPHRPVVMLRWPSDPEEEALDVLHALARDTAYLGHSASVVRCRFLIDAAADSELLETAPLRQVYPGRLAMLERDYRLGRRSLPGESLRALLTELPQDIPQSVFADRWIVLEDTDGNGRCPDLRAAAVVTRRFREALMSRYGDAGLAVPEFISGHQPDGSPSTAAHLAIVPMAHAGYAHAEGRLMGLALILPRQLERDRQKAEHDWLSGLADAGNAVRQWRTFDAALAQITELKLGALGAWEVARTLDTPKKSLQTGRYVRAQRRWASITPVVLDRFPKAKTAAERDREIASMLAAACVNIGLPEPSSVRASKHSAIQGAPSAYPSGNAPVWTGWTLPGFLAKRMLIHVVIEFEEPVRGPVVIGAGRFLGLGLCVGGPA